MKPSRSSLLAIVTQIRSLNCDLPVFQMARLPPLLDANGVFHATTGVILTCSLLLALSINSLDKIFALFGALAGSFVVYILPAAIFVSMTYLNSRGLLSQLQRIGSMDHLVLAEEEREACGKSLGSPHSGTAFFDNGATPPAALQVDSRVFFSNEAGPAPSSSAVRDELTPDDDSNWPPTWQSTWLNLPAKDRLQTAATLLMGVLILLGGTAVAVVDIVAIPDNPGSQ